MRNHTLITPKGVTHAEYCDKAYGNGIFSFLQPGGSVREVSYFAREADMDYQGWVMPSEDVDACAEGVGLPGSPLDGVAIGGHGGSYITATQAARMSELTGMGAIGRPLPVEIDGTHMYHREVEPDGKPGYRWPAHTADAAAPADYRGNIPALQMGSILTLSEQYNCALMRTRPSQRLCEVARDHGLFVVDNSGGENEIQFPAESGVVDEVIARTGVDLHNAQDPDGDGDPVETIKYAEDMRTLFASLVVLDNPEVAWVSLWDGAVDLGSGWRYLDWFGFFNVTSDPWIYHQQLDWMYVSGTSASDLWIYHPKMAAWLWTSNATFPWLYRATGPSPSWLYYLEWTTGPAWFHNQTTDVWESY